MNLKEILALPSIAQSVELPNIPLTYIKLLAKVWKALGYNVSPFAFTFFKHLKLK